MICFEQLELEQITLHLVPLKRGTQCSPSVFAYRPLYNFSFSGSILKVDVSYTKFYEICYEIFRMWSVCKKTFVCLECVHRIRLFRDIYFKSLTNTSLLAGLWPAYKLACESF